MQEKIEFKNNGIRIKVTDIPEVAMCLNRTVPFARDKNRKLYYYDNGVYKSGGEDKIERLYIALCREENSLSSWRENNNKNLTAFIRAEAEELLERPLSDRINFKNGIYYLDSNGNGNFESHTEYDHSAYRTTIQIPITYNPSAQCPSWLQFLEEVFPEDVNLLIDIVGLCMVPFTGLQKCIVLLGGGSNGKGTFLSAIQYAVGRENFASLDLKRLTGKDDRFSTACLVGKLVNVFGDLPPTKMENTSIFKALTGEDHIMVEFKGRQAFPYHPFARMLFSCNEMIESDDKTVGYKRRFFCIPFDAQFAVDPKKKQEIEESLSSEEELSGLANIIVQRLPMVMENGLIYNEAAAAKVENYIPIPDWFKMWFKLNILVDSEAKIPVEDMYLHYATTAGTFKPSEQGLDKASMINYLKAIVPSLICGKPVNHNGKTTRCYVGIKLLDTAERVWQRGEVVGSR